MGLQTDGPVFIPIPEGDIAHLATFYEYALLEDYQLYVYRRNLTTPQDPQVEELFEAISNSSIISNATDAGHYVIHQSGGSWVGSGIDEFREQLNNQIERYDSVPEGYTLRTYKNETAIYIQLLATGDYLVINADPWKLTRGRGMAAGRRFRNFEIRLILDGLPLNDGRLDEFLNRTKLEFGTGNPWSPTTQTLSGRAIAGVTVDIKECIEDHEGYIDHVVCENPLYGKSEFLSRLFARSVNIVSEYEYIIASCNFTQQNADSATVNRISVTNYDRIGRHTTQNISLDVSLNR